MTLLPIAILSFWQRFLALHWGSKNGSSLFILGSLRHHHNTNCSSWRANALSPLLQRQQQAPSQGLCCPKSLTTNSGRPEARFLRNATLLFPPLPSEAEARQAQGSSLCSLTYLLPLSPWRDLQWPICTCVQSFIFTTALQESVLLLTSFLPFGEEKGPITYGIPRSQKRDSSSCRCHWWENTHKHNPDSE